MKKFKNLHLTETLAKTEKPSILGQLKDVQESVAKPDTGLEKKPSDLEL